VLISPKFRLKKLARLRNVLFLNKSKMAANVQNCESVSVKTVIVVGSVRARF
jgi:hypothetical protein